MKMGLSNERTGGTLVYASKGKFQVKNTGGGYDEFSYLRGSLTGIQFSDKKGHEGKEFRQMLLTFVDGDSSFSLSLDSSNGYSQQIKAKLASIEDFSSPLELNLTYDPESKKAGAFVNQNAQSIRQAWTKDSKPKGMPDAKCLGKQKGKDVYDFSDQDAWIEDYLMREVAPKLKHIVPASVSSTGGDSGGLSDRHHEEGHEGFVPFKTMDDAPF